MHASPSADSEMVVVLFEYNEPSIFKTHDSAMYGYLLQIIQFTCRQAITPPINEVCTR